MQQCRSDLGGRGVVSTSPSPLASLLGDDAPHRLLLDARDSLSNCYGFTQEAPGLAEPLADRLRRRRVPVVPEAALAVPLPGLRPRFFAILPRPSSLRPL